MCIRDRAPGGHLCYGYSPAGGSCHGNRREDQERQYVRSGFLQIPVDISHILGNLITVIFDYQILRKPLKILSL